MSSPAHSRLDADVDASKTAKFLANLQRTVGRRDPDDAPVATGSTGKLPVHAEVTEPQPVAEARQGRAPEAPDSTKTPAEPTTSSSVQASVPVTRSQPAKAKRSRSDNKPDRMQVEVTLDPGTASRVVYVRVDKTLADRLALIAFQNKINGGEGPATINDIGVAALNRWLDEYEQAA